MKKIQLTRGKFAIVDNADYAFINQWKWCFDGRYAVRTEYLGRKNGRQKGKTILMHKIINGTVDGYHTDHINGDGLDNRRRNLRACTIAQNAQNQKIRTYKSSKFKGVHWSKSEKKWRAKIGTKSIGYFTNEVAAAMAYNNAALLKFGRFARLNEF